MVTVSGFTDVAIQTAVNTALANRMDTVFLPAGNYVISNAITIDFTPYENPTDKRGIKFLGDNARLQVTGTLNSFYAFNILCNTAAQNNTRILFENLWFYTDNINRPNGIYSNYACFITIKDCVFYQLWQATNIRFGGMVRVDNSYFWGCNQGAYFYRTRDCAISNSSAYGCNEGIIFEGVNDVGTDGGFIIQNCQVNVCSQSGIRIRGAYTPIIDGAIVENNNPNIKIENSQYGILSNVWSGPSTGYSIFFTKIAGALTNDYWTLNNITLQTEARFENLNFSTINNLISAGVNTSGSGSCIDFNACSIVEINSTTVRAIGGSVANSLLIESNANSFRINGGIYDKQIRFNGSSRTGRNTFNGLQTYADISFDTSIMPSETGNYFLWNGTSFIKKEVSGQVLTPSNVLQLTLTAGQTTSYDIASIMADPGALNISHATFMAVGGTTGSYSVATIDSVRSNNNGATIIGKSTILNYTGNVGSCAITIDANGRSIKFQNTTGSTTITVKLILAFYNLINY